ncbi:MAG: tetratricopeptide repeat protein [Thermodesulfobacteriota bacterium]
MVQPPTLAPDPSVTDLLDQVLTFYRQGRLQEAQDGCETILARVPDHPEALHLLGVVAYSLSRFDEACRLMERADRLHPASPTLHLCDYAIALAAAERHPEVIAACRRALAINPCLYRAHGRMGTAFQQLGRTEEALTCYNTALRMQPAYADGYFYLGSALLDLGYREEALVAFREALRLGPESPAVGTLLGNAFNRLDLAAEATAAYKTALAMNEILEKAANDERRASNAILRGLCAPISGRIVSIGSANDSDKEGGLYREYFPGAASYLRIDCNRHAYPDLVADIQDLRPVLPDRACDAVFCIWVLEHVPDVHAALAEIRRILVPGGSFIFCLPLNVGFHSFPHDYHRFTRDGIERLCRGAFRVETIHAIGEETPFTLDPRLALIGAGRQTALHSHVGLCRAI